MMMMMMMKKEEEEEDTICMERCGGEYTLIFIP
jgi:hypothetical protein